MYKKIIFFVVIVSIIYLIRASIINSQERDEVLQINSERSSKVLISFPKDHNIHENFTREWWYLNLDLTVEEEIGGKKVINRLGQVFSFSSIKESGKTFNLLLSGNLDTKTSKFNFVNNEGSLKSNLNSNLLTVEFINSNTNLKLIEQKGSANLSVFKLSGLVPNIGEVDLTFSQNSNYKSPTLWGDGKNNVCSGNISIFAPNDTFYYSIPGYVVSGTIKTPGKAITKILGGIGWLDHQWFNSNSITQNWKGHYWFSSHFSTNSLVNFSKLNNDELKKSSIIATAAVKNMGSNQSFYSISRDENGNSKCSTNGTLEPTSFLQSGYPNILVFKDFDNSSINLKSLQGKEVYSIGFTTKFVEFLSNATLITSSKKNYRGSGFIETGLKK